MTDNFLNADGLAFVAETLYNDLATESFVVEQIEKSIGNINTLLLDRLDGTAQS